MNRRFFTVVAVTTMAALGATQALAVYQVIPGV